MHMEQYLEHRSAHRSVRRSPHRRGRALAALVAVAGLGLASAAVIGTPAQAAAPDGCVQPYPVADLAAGQAVTGLTVSQGTTPDGFTGEVIGVLDDGIAPDVDMIMVRLTSPAIDRLGIWQGMSGSPVYAADGRLIGAVAYGLASGPSPVAGVTPFAEMDDYLPGAATVPPPDVAPDAQPASSVPVPRAAARAIARHTDVRAADAAQGFSQLPVPFGVAGVGARQLATAAEHAGSRSYLPRSAYAIGRAAPDAAGPDTVVPGGNLAASLSYGDITMAGVGTATYVCDGEVVAFGHPLDYLGATSLTLHPADALYVQEDLFAGFKVANLGAPAGTITDDRLTGLTGELGPVPDTAQVDASLSYLDRSRSGTTHVSVRTPDALASTTFYQFLANHDRVVDGRADGSEEAGWTVAGTGPDGTPFALTSSNLYAPEWDLEYEVGFALGDIVYALAQIPGVTIDHVATTTTVYDQRASYRITGLERKVHGTWTRLSQRRPLVVRPGTRLVLRAVLAGTTADAVPFTVTVPDSLGRRGALLDVVGGTYTGGLGPMRTLEQAQAAVDGLVRNDQILVSLATPGRRHAADAQTQELGPLDGVVAGERSVMVEVRRR